jgi:uncharacterized membrane protein
MSMRACGGKLSAPLTPPATRRNEPVMAKRPSHLIKPFRIVNAHVWLFAAVAIGAALAFLLPGEWRLATRLLIGWNVGVTIFLAHAFFTIARFDVQQARRRAAEQDEGAVLMLVLTVAAAIASLAAIVAELGFARQAGGSQVLYFLHAAVTILLSWTFIHVIFAFHYAHEYFGQGGPGGLDFPGRGSPDYWDFVYFAFVVGTTFQTSDVDITGKRHRRTVTAHGIVSFFFNVAILALTVNIGSDLIGGSGKGK